MIRASEGSRAEAGLLQRAGELLPLIGRLGEAGERLGALSPEVAEALRAAGLFAMWVPRCLGGAELGPVDSLELIERVAHADGSTGWVLMAAALATGTAGAYLGDRAVAEIFRRTPLPVMAGQGAPVGSARRVDGGYLLSGRWSYGSGVRHADYLHTGALAGEGETAEARIFIVPREHFEFAGNWDVLGLRATGSIDYSGAGIFVPADATHLTDCATPLRGGAFYRLGIKGMGSIGHTGFALGVARRALDEIAALAAGKSGRLGLLGDSESFLERFGAAEAQLRAARALAFETWRDIEAGLHRGEPLPIRQQSLHRLALNHATWTASEVCTFAYHAGGGTSLRAGAIQRCFRDMHAGTQHISSASVVLRDCGRELAGLAGNREWGFTTLIQK